MHIEDVDYEFKTGIFTIKLSELTKDDIEQISKISEAILMQKIFDCPTKALIAGFQLFIEAYAETNNWNEEGNLHH